MSATEFTVDMQDIQFVLFDQFKVHELAKAESYQDFDRDTCLSMMEEAARIAIEVLHPVNKPGDLEGCHIEGNVVTTPAGYQEAWKVLCEGGWVGMSAPQEMGGIGFPYPLTMTAQEMFNGACTSMTMYSGLTAGAARLVMEHGMGFNRQMVTEKMFSGEWAGTMCLTEAGAGSAVGDNRCKATRTDEPHTYLLEGEKIFITGGEHDLADNIIHLVLARTADAPTGSKGLSIFAVPKFLFDDEGNIGARNDIRAVGIEHKMGIKGSSTCTLALGSQGPCKAWILGQEGQGLPIMFHVMNEARVGVAGQGHALAAAAYNYALSYAKDRIQGTDIANFKDASARRVSIIEHPDVRRMLMWIKVHVETMRSLLCRLATDMSRVEGGLVSGKEAESIVGQVDLLVPVAKAHCTDRGFDCCVQALQIFGGYGYINEYPVEQLVRDAKIMTIYEGTNGIQALDLVGRKLRTKQGALFMEWMQKSQAKTEAAKKMGLEDEAKAVYNAINHVGTAAMSMSGVAMQGDLHGAMQHATPFQTMLGIVVLAVEALDQATIATQLIAEKGETPHLIGKTLNATWYANNVLPEAVAIGKSIRNNDRTALDSRLFN